MSWESTRQVTRNISAAELSAMLIVHLKKEIPRYVQNIAHKLPLGSAQNVALKLPHSTLGSALIRT